MGTSHLVMGELTDYLTGQTLPDTHDERLIQKISRFLIEDRGFAKNEILTRRKMPVAVGDKTGSVTVHFVVRIDETFLAVIMYGPGSIVTRQRPTIAVARLFSDYMIPFAVITNGYDANLMDTRTGKVIGKDLGSIFTKKEAMALLTDFHPERLSKDRRKKEQRILYAMDILTEAECAEYVCKIC